MKKNIHKNPVCMNLQKFAEGGVSGAPASDAGATSDNAGMGETFNASSPNEAKKTVYGKQKTINSVTAENPERKNFADVFKEYGDEAKDFMDKTFARRMSKYKNLEAENEKMKSVLESANFRYNINNESETYLDDLKKAIEGDTKLYEEEAIEQGISVEQLLKVKNAERVLAHNKAVEQQRAEDAKAQAFARELSMQAAAMQQKYPAFNLDAEMQNDKFRKLVLPMEVGGVGLSLEDAFTVAHHKEILEQTTRNAVNQATLNTANQMAVNRKRPKDNGMSKSGTVIVKDDPSKLTLDDFKRIKEEYRRTGHRITF